MIHIDAKLTVWERFSIEPEHKDKLMAFLEQNPNADAGDILDWASELDEVGVTDFETLSDTEEALTPADNKGQATVEVTLGHETLWTNEPPDKLWENAPTDPAPIPLADLERYEQIAEDTKKVFSYNKHSGHWMWSDRAGHGIGNPNQTGFPTRLEALLDAIEPYLEDPEEQ